jgi:antitoxin component YwqK of YwqJK toxin-antitoxin module
MRKFIIFNVFLCALLVFSGDAIGQENEGEVIVKTDFLSMEPVISEQYFYLNGEKIASKKYQLNLTKNAEKMMTLLSEEGNVPDGAVKEYAPNGVLAKESSYLNNMMHGLFKSYYPSGEIAMTTMWDKNEIVNIKQFDKKGNITQETVLKDGKPVSYNNQKIGE